MKDEGCLARFFFEIPLESIMVIAVIVAIAVPLIFLFMVRWLDLYASGSLKVVVICLLWGVVAFVLAFQANTVALGLVGMGLLVTLVAPMIEEVLKSLILVYEVRRPNFTYFVDGAIYGFAAGTGFAVVENLLYLGRAGAVGGVGMAVSRAFSTALMHGSASALVGVALGRMRFGRGFSRIASLLLGWAAAMALHITFNNLISANMGVLTLVLAMLIGMGGVALNAGFIFWGLREERRWLRETLQLAVGVSVGESNVVQQIDSLDELLAPIAEHFGVEKRKQVEAFLRLQARLGLKRKVQEQTADPKLRAALDAQVQALRQEMDTLRRAVGVYCMAYVRSILPPETEPIWARLDQSLLAQQGASGRNLWSTLSDKMDPAG
jgi:RsiW-degrading membrane proteinase PrsW (M82 family)